MTWMSQIRNLFPKFQLKYALWIKQSVDEISLAEL